MKSRNREWLIVFILLVAMVAWSLTAYDYGKNNPSEVLLNISYNEGFADAQVVCIGVLEGGDANALFKQHFKLFGKYTKPQQ